MYDRVTPKTAAERVMRCGIGPVTVKSEAELDTEVLVVTANGPLTDEQIACIDKAASFYDVKLPASAQSRFDRARETRAAAYMAGEGRKWLLAHRLLDRLPSYRSGVTQDADVAHKIEELCHAEGALSSSFGVHAVSPDWVMKNSGKIKQDGPFVCLLNAAWASGYQLGFIGNEAYAPNR
jgi:hypothetical protein